MLGNPQDIANYTKLVYWYPHQGVKGSLGLEAITGGVFYHCTENCYPSQLEGAYFFGDFGVGFISALLPSSASSPEVDPATNVTRLQVQTIMHGLYLAPADLQVWNGKVYLSTLTGNIAVLNYD
jgi:hypothetical protein